MPKWFYYDASETKIGPLSDGQLKTLCQNGTIARTTILETDSGQKGRAEQVKGLFPSKSTPQTHAPISSPAPTSAPVPASKPTSAPVPGYTQEPVYPSVPANPSPPGYTQAPVYPSAPVNPPAPGYGPVPGYPPAPIPGPSTPMYPSMPGTTQNMMNSSPGTGMPMGIPYTGIPSDIRLTTSNLNSNINGEHYINDNAIAGTFQNDLFSVSSLAGPAFFVSLILRNFELAMISVLILVFSAAAEDMSGPLTLIILFGIFQNLRALATWLIAKNTSVQLTSRTVLIERGLFNIQTTEISFHNIKAVNGTKSFFERFFNCGGITIIQANGSVDKAKFLPSVAVKQIRDTILAYTVKSLTSAR